MTACLSANGCSRLDHKIQVPTANSFTHTRVEPTMHNKRRRHTQVLPVDKQATMIHEIVIEPDALARPNKMARSGEVDDDDEASAVSGITGDSAQDVLAAIKAFNKTLKEWNKMLAQQLVYQKQSYELQKRSVEIQEQELAFKKQELEFAKKNFKSQKEVSEYKAKKHYADMILLMQNIRDKSDDEDRKVRIDAKIDEYKAKLGIKRKEDVPVDVMNDDDDDVDIGVDVVATEA
jgi:hypothetical protein